MLLFVFLGKITSMKTPFFLIALSLVILSCGSGKSPVKIESNSDTVRIANDSLEYEIIIIEPGFNSWLVTQPKESFYSQEYLEIKNRSTRLNSSHVRISYAVFCLKKKNKPTTHCMTS